MGFFFKSGRTGNAGDINNSGFIKSPSFFNINSGLSGLKKGSENKKIRPVTIFAAVVFFGILLIYILSSRQQPTAPQNAAVSNAGAGGIDLVIKLVIGMAIVAALIYITVYILRIFYAKKGKVQMPVNIVSNGIINILECINLDCNRKLYLVKIADKVLLISSSENQVNLITEFNKDDIAPIQSVIAGNNNNSEEGKNFRSVLSGLFKNNA